MALLLLASEAFRSGRVGSFIACHVDHGSRPDSACDADVIREVCASLGVPFIATQIQHGAKMSGQSVEASWREGRYRALLRECGRLGLQTLVTAHTHDDQVENVLMRLFSGSSRLTIPHTAMRSENSVDVQILRPLLGVTRPELERVVKVAGVTPVEDASNADVSYRRNAIRHSVIPVVEKVYPGFGHALVRSAVIREEDGALCDDLAQVVFFCNAQRGERNLALPRELLIESHQAIASRLVMLAARELIADTDNRELTRERVQSVLKAASGRGGAVIELPYGVRATVVRENIVFSLWEGT